MSRGGLYFGSAAWLMIAACTSTGSVAPDRLSIEFGHEFYLTDEYVQRAANSRCGPPTYAPSGTEVLAPLPDGTWFRLFAMQDDEGTWETVILERGLDGEEAQLAMRLDAAEGIVRLREGERRDAWGINHAWADWMRTLGERASSLLCAAPE